MACARLVFLVKLWRFRSCSSSQVVDFPFVPLVAQWQFYGPRLFVGSFSSTVAVHDGRCTSVEQAIVHAFTLLVVAQELLNTKKADVPAPAGSSRFTSRGRGRRGRFPWSKDLFGGPWRFLAVAVHAGVVDGSARRSSLCRCAAVFLVGRRYRPEISLSISQLLAWWNVGLMVFGRARDTQVSGPVWTRSHIKDVGIP